jgi:hypothetical protein
MIHNYRKIASKPVVDAKVSDVQEKETHGILFTPVVLKSNSSYVKKPIKRKAASTPLSNLEAFLQPNHFETFELAMQKKQHQQPISNLEDFLQPIHFETSELLMHKKSELDFDFNADDSSTTSRSDTFVDADHQITYRVGDWIYCEQEPDQPYVVRKIEEFKQTPADDGSSPTIEAKLRCAYRRSDVPQSLLSSFQKRNSFYLNCLQSSTSTTTTTTTTTTNNNNNNNTSTSTEETQPSSALEDQLQQAHNLTPLQLYQLKHHELFYSKFTEPSISVKKFRGKVNLNLFMPDVVAFSDFVQPQQQQQHQDNYFYQISYDPNLKLISDDRTQIRVGARFQADMPSQLLQKSSLNKMEQQQQQPTEELVWLDQEQSVGGLSKLALNNYFKRIIDKKIRQNEQFSLNHSKCEVNESRDSIMYDAMQHLHANAYDRHKSAESFDLANLSRPLPKVWTQLEMKQFELGIAEHGKDFFKIRLLYLPDKPLKSIIEYYYNIWKTTESYINKREEKCLEKKKKMTEIAQTTNQTHHLLAAYSEESQSQNNSFDSNQEDILCSSCLKNKSKLSFNRNVNCFRLPTSTTNATSQNQELIFDSLTQQSSGLSSLLKANVTGEAVSTVVPEVRLSLNKQQNFSIFSDSQSRTQQSVKCEALCNQCWIYWKKFGSLKYSYYENTSRHSMLKERICPERRQERINAIRKQTFICSIDKCDKEFEFKQRADYASHSLTAHCLILRQLVPSMRPSFKVLDNFSLQPTSLTKEAIKRFQAASPGKKNYFKRLARNPTRRPCDLTSIKKFFVSNSPLRIKIDTSFSSSHISSSRSQQEGVDNSSKRQLSQISARPMTPMSPSVHVETFFRNLKKLDPTEPNLASIYKYPVECLSPSPSPTPSPSSKNAKNPNSTPHNDDLLCKYLRADDYYTKTRGRRTKAAAVAEKEPKTNTPTINNLTVMTSLTDKFEAMKEYARMKQKKFILSRFLYFKANKSLRLDRCAHIQSKRLKQLGRNPFKLFKAPDIFAKLQTTVTTKSPPEPVVIHPNKINNIKKLYNIKKLSNTSRRVKN